MQGTVTKSAVLYGARLTRANLSGANLSNVNLLAADVRDAIYNWRTIWPDGFDPVAAGAILVET